MRAEAAWLIATLASWALYLLVFAFPLLVAWLFYRPFERSLPKKKEEAWRAGGGDAWRAYEKSERRGCGVAIVGYGVGLAIIVMVFELWPDVERAWRALH